ncbi:MAG: hypothetical protein C4539_18255 [Ignavibacteriales bacterium]|nr:MAG: hypothetical protein C4539_18255 [Ignavibacteriales bacterium]
MKTKIFFIILLAVSICVKIKADDEVKKKITIAVLYFDNNSVIDKEKLDPLGKGIAQMLITEVTKQSAFKVVERERLNDLLKEQQLSLSGAVEQSTIQKVGKLLGAQTLLFGSYVNFYGGEMRLDMRIVETETGLTLKAEEETGDVEDLFDMIKNLSDKVADYYDIELSKDETATLVENEGKLNVEASLSFSKGIALEEQARQLLKNGDRFNSIKLYKDAISMYESALSTTPGFSEAAERIHNLNLAMVSVDIKDNKPTGEKPPSLSILEPEIMSGKDVVFKENKMTVRGKAVPAGGFNDITVNGQKVNFISDNEFFLNLDLQEGINDVQIRSVDKNDKSETISFKVNHQKEIVAPIITLLEPRLTRGIKVVSKSDVIKVRGIAIDDNGISQVLVNGKPVNVSPNGDFSSEVFLKQGANDIIIKAMDLMNNTSEEKFVFQKGEKQEDVIDATGKRNALVIGNSNYKSAPLRNPVNDANAISQTLKQTGFDVTLALDVKTQNDLKKIIREFGKKLRNGEVGLFYYSGHGLQVKGINYLVPVEAEIAKEEDVEFEGVDVNMVLAEMEFAKNKLNIVILDACRNNPFARSFRSAANGLVQLNAPVGTLIAYSTAPGSVASDGAGSNGLWTEEFLNAVKVPGSKIEDVFKHVRSNVRKKSNNEQIPWESSSIEGDFYFIQ